VFDYLEELKKHGFVHVVRHVHSIPLHQAQSDSIGGEIIRNWTVGLEASALKLMSKHLGMHGYEILLECAAARKALQMGVNGCLEM
jgi:hypothetical protein